jgi:hypothetical protein
MTPQLQKDVHPPSRCYLIICRNFKIMFMKIVSVIQNQNFHRLLLCLVGLGALVLLSLGNAKPQTWELERDQVWALVRKEVLAEKLEGKVVHISRSPLKAGQAVESWKQRYPVPEEFALAWFVFIDDQPEANWEHPCRYIFVDARTGKFQVFKSSTPPNRLDQMIKVHP